MYKVLLLACANTLIVGTNIGNKYVEGEPSRGKEEERTGWCAYVGD